jgi:hypothetical protein
MQGLVAGVATGITTLIVAVIAVVCVAMMSWGGLVWATAGGSPRRAQEGQEILVRGAIGLVVALGAPLIVATIRGWTGL